jgi:L-ascorbate metabolism protein UlaG (beta-lactamase superfamily)
VWFGHTSFWIDAGDRRFMVDPVFSERASPLLRAGPRRRVEPPLPLHALPRLDAVLLTHDHYDHLDAPSIRYLASRPGSGPLFLAPLGVDAWLRRRGISNVLGLDWYQSGMIGRVRVTLLPAQHWSSRTPFDRQRRLWGGWLLETDEFAFVHLGDTGYGPVLEDLGAFLRQRVPQGVDLAAVPVGAYEPRWFMAGQHLDPAEAVRLHRNLAFRRSIPVHWGTFWLTDEPLDEPPRRLLRELEAQGVPPGEFAPVAVGELVHPQKTKADP